MLNMFVCYCLCIFLIPFSNFSLSTFFHPNMFLDPNKPFVLFSNKGNLSQCDNALTAALNGSLCLGLSSSDGAVLISLKSLPSLADLSHHHKVFNVCPTIGMTYSGLQPDFRVQLSLAQRIALDYFEVYGVYPCINTFINEYSLAMNEMCSRGMRPFGTYLLFTGVSNTGTPTIFKLDPSGSFNSSNFAASGDNYENAISFLQKRHGSLDDNISTCLSALKEHSGREIHAEDISVGVYKNGKFRVMNEEEKDELFA